MTPCVVCMLLVYIVLETVFTYPGQKITYLCSGCVFCIVDLVFLLFQRIGIRYLKCFAETYSLS